MEFQIINNIKYLSSVAIEQNYSKEMTQMSHTMQSKIMKKQKDKKQKCVFIQGLHRKLV